MSRSWHTYFIKNENSVDAKSAEGMRAPALNQLGPGLFIGLSVTCLVVLVLSRRGFVFKFRSDLDSVPHINQSLVLRSRNMKAYYNYIRMKINTTSRGSFDLSSERQGTFEYLKAVGVHLF